jgi:hypothetical protein
LPLALLQRPIPIPPSPLRPPTTLPAIEEATLAAPLEGNPVLLALGDGDRSAAVLAGGWGKESTSSRSSDRNGSSGLLTEVEVDVIVVAVVVVAAAAAAGAADDDEGSARSGVGSRGGSGGGAFLDGVSSEGGNGGGGGESVSGGEGGPRTGDGEGAEDVEEASSMEGENGDGSLSVFSLLPSGRAAAAAKSAVSPSSSVCRT